MPRINPKSKLGLFVSHVVPGVMRPMRVLWNEVFSFVFIALAVPMAFRVIRAFRDEDFKSVMILGPLVMLFVYFGVTSYLRARKISRS